jgi:LuxR family transcriptional regulator
MKLRSYLAQIIDCQTIQDLWDGHVAQMAGFGFDRLLYGFTRYRTSTSLGDPSDFIILTNHARAYTDVFLNEGHYFNAPMVHWALNNEGAKSWKLIAEMERTKTLSAAERRVLEFNRDMDVVAGYSISFKSVSMRTKGAIALTARKGMEQAEVDSIWAEHGADIMLMNNIVHLKILTLPYSAPNRGLTARQREALEWVGDGKTSQDIALLMGLTTATVEKHLRLARAALDVETTAQAVMRAAFSNQMFVLEV